MTFFSRMILIIASVVFPLPNGLIHRFSAADMVFAASKMFFGSVPASLFEPTSNVSVRSVLSISTLRRELAAPLTSCWGLTHLIRDPSFE